MKVRICVVVDSQGNWSCDGGSFRHMDEEDLLGACADGHDQPLAAYWLEVDIPVPSAEVETLTPSHVSGNSFNSAMEEGDEEPLGPIPAEPASDKPCGSCGGRGYVPKDGPGDRPCQDCAGVGAFPAEPTFNSPEAAAQAAEKLSGGGSSFFRPGDADVLTKRRVSTGREVHYFIGPLRDSLEEAQEDRDRWASAPSRKAKERQGGELPARVEDGEAGSPEAVESSAESIRGFTPGPWQCKPISDRLLNHHRGYEIRGPETETYIRDVREDEIDANARLIAAAPDLLAERDHLRRESSELRRQEGELLLEIERLRGDAAVKRDFVEELSRAEWQRDALAEALESLLRSDLLLPSDTKEATIAAARKAGWDALNAAGRLP